MSFAYNDAGLRISKTANDVTTHYVYDGDILVAEYTDSETIVYIYDAYDSPIGFKYRSSSYTSDTWDVYWYGKNIQGDIVAVYSSTGTVLINYTYTAWGKTEISYYHSGASTTAVKNNLTYRGYYYDSDLGLYYLQSRYYDPNTCRFINADGALYHSMLGYNLFVYCENTPVTRVDPSGDYSVDIKDEDGNPLDDWMTRGLEGGGGGYTTEFSTGGPVTVTDSMARNHRSMNSGEVRSTFLPESYYTKNKAPKFSTPKTSNTTIRYKSYTGEYEVSTTYYDYAGRQFMRIDWTNHGYADHGNPHIHFTFYSNIYPDGISRKVD